MSAGSGTQILLRIGHWNQGIALGGAALAALGVIIGLATSNTAITSLSVSVGLGGAIGWLVAGGLTGRKR